MSYVFVSHEKKKKNKNKTKQKHIFAKREVLSGLNAHAEEDLAEAILIAVQIAWMNESPKITFPF